jgi:hypothetical protein
MTLCVSPDPNLCFFGCSSSTLVPGLGALILPTGDVALVPGSRNLYARQTRPAASDLESAAARVSIGARVEAVIGDLVHPVHAYGRLFAWEIHPR